METGPAPTLRPYWQRPDGWLLGCALGLGYWLTGARGLWWFDSGELALVAVENGGSHPPGQPLHTLLSHLLTYLGPEPLLGPALLSFLPGGLCGMCALGLCEQLSGPAVRLPERVLRGALLLAAGMSWPLWEPAARIEVYALATALLLLQQLRLQGLLRSREAVLRPWPLLLDGMLLGWLCSTNLLLGAVAASITLGALLLRLATLRAPVRHWLALPLRWGGGLAFGLAPYLQLGWAALRSPQDGRWVWGQLLDLRGLVHFLRGADYAYGPRPLTPDRWLVQTWELGSHLLGQPAWLLLAGGLVPLVLLTLRQRWLVVAWLPALLLLLIVSASVPLLPDNPDYLGYLAYGGWLCAVAWTVALLPGSASPTPLALGHRDDERSVGSGPASVATAASSRADREPEAGSRSTTWSRIRLRQLVLALILAVAWWYVPPVAWSRGRADRELPRALGEAALREAPPGAIFVVGSDHLVFTTLYLQRVERRRPDVVLVPWGLGASSWLYADLVRHHPGLALPPPANSTPERIRGLLAANPDRPFVFELFDLAREVLPGARLSWGALLMHERALPADFCGQLRIELSDLLRSGVGFAPMDDQVLAFTARVVAGHARRDGEPAWSYQLLAAAAPPGPELIRLAQHLRGDGGGRPAIPRVPPGSCWAAPDPPTLPPPFFYPRGCLPADLAYLAWSAGDLATAEQLLAQGRALECGPAWLVGADLALSQGQLALAAAQLDDFEAVFADEAAAAYFRAELSRRLGDRDGVQRWLELAMHHPTLGDAARQRAVFLAPRLR